MGDVVASGILLFKISCVILYFLSMNPRYRITVRISLIRLLRFILLGGEIIGFTSYTSLVIPGLYGTKQFNPLFRSNSVVVAILPLNLLLHCCGWSVLILFVDNLLFEIHIPGAPGGFVVILIFPAWRRE